MVGGGGVDARLRDTLPAAGERGQLTGGWCAGESVPRMAVQTSPDYVVPAPATIRLRFLRRRLPMMTPIAQQVEGGERRRVLSRLVALAFGLPPPLLQAHPPEHPGALSPRTDKSTTLQPRRSSGRKPIGIARRLGWKGRTTIAERRADVAVEPLPLVADGLDRYVSDGA